MDNSPEIKIKEERVLADDWSTLKKVVLDFKMPDGTWEELTRETYDRGNGATILLYNTTKQTVILVRQFRYPVYVNGHHGMMIEAPAGLLDEHDPETAIKLEVEQETGYHVHDVQKIREIYMSPGSVTEKLYFFVAEYSEKKKQGHGGGLDEEGEHIDVLEIPFIDALAMIERGEIVDGKTIILLQHAQVHGLIELS